MNALSVFLLLASSSFAHGTPAPNPWLAGAGPATAATTTTTAYVDTVCKPPKAHPGDPLPPCVGVENLEYLCYPNGTEPLYLAAHAQCMCHGSFFAEWTACQRCHAVHGQLSGDGLVRFGSIAAAVSTSLCGFIAPGDPSAAAPTAMFRDLLTSAQASISATATATASASASAAKAKASGTGQASLDPAAGNTDVGLYYTASGPLGPGRITGSAASATATMLVLDTGVPPRPPGAALSHASTSAASVQRPSSAVLLAAAFFRLAFSRN